jgi:ribosomal protein S12 methylthiotransferase accessory factor
MPRIRLSPSASITPTEAGVLLRSDLGTFQLDGRDVQLFITSIVPLLDGSHDREALADALRNYSRQSVMALLSLLEQQGIVETVPESPQTPHQQRWRGQEEFFQKWTDHPEQIVRILSEARVLVVGLEPWGVVAASELAASGVGTLHLLDAGKITHDDLLASRIWGDRELGLPRSQALTEYLAETFPWCRTTAGPISISPGNSLALDDSEWDLIIGATVADDLLLLQSLARFAHNSGVRSLIGNLEGLSAVVGPAVVPGKTACWNCARLRQLANSTYPQEAHTLQASLLTERAKPRTRTYLAPMGPMLGHLLALQALQLISEYTPSKLVGRLLVQNLVTLETTYHTVTRMPWCEVCGGASGITNNTSPRDPDSKNTKNGGENNSKNGSENGGDHVARRRLNEITDPGELRESLAGLVDERTGVVKYLLVEIPDAMEPELPVTSSAVLGTYTEGKYLPDGPELGSGKGLSVNEAMLSAAGEAIERYSAARYRKSNMRRSSFNNLQEDALDPRRLCLYDEAQYAEPDFPFVPFDPDSAIDWTRGYWIDSGEPVWLPALPTYFNYHVPPGEYFCQVTSNGLAAGAHPEDAARRAIFELLERDAFMLTWLCQRPGQRVLLDNMIDADVREVARQLTEHGVAVELYLVDAELPIYTILSLALGDGKNWPAVAVALAAHSNPVTAARKSLLELGHVTPYVRRMMLDGQYTIPTRPEDVRTLTDHALYYTSPDRVSLLDFLRFGGGTPVSLAELEKPQDNSLVVWGKKLAATGVRVAVVDVTSPDLLGSAFRVARAFGIDAQPIDFGFKLRRLGNPRLKTLLAKGPNSSFNPHPHPVA